MSGSRLCIPRNETVQPRFFQNIITMFCCSFFQFLHSYICERFIYFQDLSVYFAAAILWNNPGTIHKLLTGIECRNWDWGRAIHFQGIHKLDFWYSVVQTALLFFDWLLHDSKPPDVLYFDLLLTCCIVQTLGCSLFWLDLALCKASNSSVFWLDVVLAAVLQETVEEVIKERRASKIIQVDFNTTW